MARSKKKLWERLDPLYFRRLSSYRAWRRWLSVACTAAAAVWIAAAVVQGDSRIYSSGQMSASHEFIADRCEKCHTSAFRGVVLTQWRDWVMNAACLDCHSVSIGHDPQTKNAWHQFAAGHPEAGAAIEACSLCHREHQGQLLLANMPDWQCVKCHGNLTAKDAQTRFHPTITGFAADHPEFRLLAAKTPDPGVIRFNHEVHLKPGIRGPEKDVVLDCADCHRAGLTTAPWPYARPDLHEAVGASAEASEPHLIGDYMHPIRYSLHCVQCHELSADQRLGTTGAVPHDKPAAIRSFLWGELTSYIREHPDKLVEATPGLSLPTLRKLSQKEQDRLTLEWVEGEVKVVEESLYKRKKTCLLCHDLQWPGTAGDLPRIVPPKIPARWFRHASFRHDKHQVIECQACHRAAPTSSLTADVLVPGIELCRQCHGPRRKGQTGPLGGVSGACILCHTYHRPPEGKVPPRGRPIGDLREKSK